MKLHVFCAVLYAIPGGYGHTPKRMERQDTDRAPPPPLLELSDSR